MPIQNLILMEADDELFNEMQQFMRMTGSSGCEILRTLQAIMAFHEQRVLPVIE